MIVGSAGTRGQHGFGLLCSVDELCECLSDRLGNVVSVIWLRWHSLQFGTYFDKTLIMKTI
eukprot:scaffold14261_cov207-Alexandrium_tamarense.AAC.1